jgi:chromosome segregation ATPase
MNDIQTSTNMKTINETIQLFHFDIIKKLNEHKEILLLSDNELKDVNEGLKEVKIELKEVKRDLKEVNEGNMSEVKRDLKEVNEGLKEVDGELKEVNESVRKVKVELKEVKMELKECNKKLDNIISMLAELKKITI